MRIIPIDVYCVMPKNTLIFEINTVITRLLLSRFGLFLDEFDVTILL